MAPAEVGQVAIELVVLAPTRVLWLNAEELAVDEAAVTAGGRRLAATPIAPGKGYLGLRFAAALPVGKATVAIRFRGKSRHDDVRGLYTVKDRDDWYAFTQFESTDARRAFPCFDEPSYKIPWRVTIHAKQPQVVEDYFGTPYPYAKLDALAWVGDMVTMAWWDDTWLNESFASWMAAKITRSVEPSWDSDVREVEVRSGVMGQDSLDSARQIAQPIETANDIENAFDEITYEKGQAVLTMIERQVTPAVFQKGVRAYLAAHAWGNATYDDFVRAMTEAAGADQKPTITRRSSPSWSAPRWRSRPATAASSCSTGCTPTPRRPSIARTAAGCSPRCAGSRIRRSSPGPGTSP